MLVSQFLVAGNYIILPIYSYLKLPLLFLYAKFGWHFRLFAYDKFRFRVNGSKGTSILKDYSYCVAKWLLDKLCTLPLSLNVISYFITLLSELLLFC